MDSPSAPSTDTHTVDIHGNTSPPGLAWNQQEPLQTQHRYNFRPASSSGPRRWLWAYYRHLLVVTGNLWYLQTCCRFGKQRSVRNTFIHSSTTLLGTPRCESLTNIRKHVININRHLCPAVLLLYSWCWKPSSETWVHHIPEVRCWTEIRWLWTFQQVSLPSSTCLNTLSCCHVIGWLHNQGSTGVPNKVSSEWYIGF